MGHWLVDILVYVIPYLKNWKQGNWQSYMKFQRIRKFFLSSLSSGSMWSNPWFATTQSNTYFRNLWTNQHPSKSKGADSIKFKLSFKTWMEKDIMSFMWSIGRGIRSPYPHVFSIIEPFVEVPDVAMKAFNSLTPILFAILLLNRRKSQAYTGKMLQKSRC